MSAARRTRKRKQSESEVPFAAGFRLPTLKQSRNAIGLSKIPKIYDPGPESAYFRRIPQPLSEDDWLAQYNEEGQSFKNFLRTCPWISGRKVKYTRQSLFPMEKISSRDTQMEKFTYNLWAILIKAVRTVVIPALMT